MKTLQVDLGARSYPIHIGRRLLGSEPLLSPHIVGPQVMIVSNETIAPLYLDKVLAGLGKYQCHAHVLPDGEQYKTLDVLKTIFDELLGRRFDRTATLVALGGGVIGDMTGFAAACFQRGVPFLQIPTTLLAQVDSSVGGKTGVNHPLGKNMIGAFYQPRCVVIDTDTLSTLDDRQLRAGLAEVIKYGIIRDPALFTWLEHNIGSLLARDASALAHAIEQSCRNKAEVVVLDEREGGLRAILNLGHTFGHAIETAMDYQGWLHGEAVAAGMYMAADLSVRLGWLAASDQKRIAALLEKAGLPLVPPPLPRDRIIELMAVDKKVQQGRLRLVLLKGIGEAVVTADYGADHLRATLATYFEA